MSSKKSRKRQKEGAEGASPSLSAASSRAGTPAPLARPDVAAPGMLVVTNFLEKGEGSAGGEAEAPEGSAARGGGRDAGAGGRPAGPGAECSRLSLSRLLCLPLLRPFRTSSRVRAALAMALGD